MNAPASAAISHKENNTQNALDTLWFTRCPVPTATGLAYKLGWLDKEFIDDGIKVATLQDNQQLSQHHYDHDLSGLIREGGNILALAARAQGAKTRLIGLTWIEEWQTILVRPDSGITSPEHLKGKRLALPSYAETAIHTHARGSSIARGMSLHGYKGALSYAGLTFDDVHFVEVTSGRNLRNSNLGSAPDAGGLQSLWAGLDALKEGRVDAVYVKGASAVDAAQAAGAVVGIDLDKLPERLFRINNGTPRPITVQESLLENHFDLVVRFLDQTLRAADWAKDNLEGVHAILQAETRSGSAGVTTAYRDDFHKTLHPDLSEEKLTYFEEQKKFLWLHGFIEHDFSIAEWTDHRPLKAALELRAIRQKAGQ
jgi:ABC-type nitrate/sulfonate/bicarbonate transport system substrate-binding protein